MVGRVSDRAIAGAVAVPCVVTQCSESPSHCVQLSPEATRMSPEIPGTVLQASKPARCQ